MGTFFLRHSVVICMYKNIRVWRLWAPRWPWAHVPCTLCTPYCYATEAVYAIKFAEIDLNFQDNWFTRIDDTQTDRHRETDRHDRVHYYMAGS